MDEQIESKKRKSKTLQTFLIVLAGLCLLTIIVVVPILATQKKQYTVTLNFGDLQESQEIVVDEGTTLDEIEIPEITYYEFAGFYLDAGFEEAVESSTAISSDMTLYLKYDIITYTITINLNDLQENQDIVINAGSVVGDIEAPEITYYEFKGFYLDADFEEVAQADTEITSDMTLYLKYELITQWLVTFDGNADDDSIEIAQESMDIVYQESYGTLPTATREGYTFEGWYLESTCETAVTEESIVTMLGNHTLYANWTANTYVVNFDTENLLVIPYNTIINSGAGGVMTVEQDFEDGTWVIKATAVEVSGSNSSAYGFYISFPFLTVGETYRWTVEIKTDAVDGHTWNYFGARRQSGERTDIEVTTEWQTFTLEYTATEDIRDPSNVIWTDFVFYGGWSEGETLYVRNISVQLADEVGGDSALPSMIVEYDSEYGTLPTPTREGYSFAGWWTKDGSQDGDWGTEVVDLTTVTTAQDHILYSRWTLNTYAVTLNFGDLQESQEIELGYGTALSEIEVPTIEDYTFVGFYLDANFEEAVDSATVITSEMTLYLKYEASVGE